MSEEAAAGAPRDAPRIVWNVDDRPPWREAVPLGLQHLLAMLLGNVTPPLLVARALGFDAATTAALIQAVLVMAGVATLVQSYPVGPVGGRIPVVMGTSIAFVAAAIAIGRDHGLPAIFGAAAVASLVEIVLGASIAKLGRLFPPLVNAVVVMLIGLTLIPVGVDYAAGGVGSATYGDLSHLGIAALVLVVALVFNQWGRGFLASASLLIGVVVGYTVCFALGRVELGDLGARGWVSLPTPLAFGFEVHWPAVLLMGFVYVISTMETIGDISGTMAACGRPPTRSELRGGLVADGAMSGVAALFGALPNTSFSQNVGLINFTGVVSRHVTAVTGGFLVLLGLFPPVAALFGSIPVEVIGGAGLIMFAMIFASGAAIVHRDVRLDQRSMVILAVSIGLGLAVELRPAVLAHLPDTVGRLFGSGLVTGGLAALLLNLVLPTRGPFDPRD